MAVPSITTVAAGGKRAAGHAFAAAPAV